MGRVLDLIAQVAQQKVEPFVAPVPWVERVAISTQDSEWTFTYTVQVSENVSRHPDVVRPGWYEFEATPDRLTRANPIDSMFIRSRFLGKMSVLPVIVLYQVRPQVWLVMPYNRSDARQRGWDGEPREMHLVWEAVLPLDICWVGQMGRLLIYDRLDDRLVMGQSLAQVVAEELRRDADRGLGGVSPELRDAAYTWRSYNRQQQEVHVRQNTAQDTAEEFRRRLEFVGARYDNYEPVLGGYRVRYTYNGTQHWVEVDPRMTVRSVGFCVAGTERRHTLTSAVHLIEDAVAVDHPGARDQGEGLSFDDLPF